MKHRIGNVLLSWSWSGNAEQPQVVGEVALDNRQLPFLLTPTTPERTWWLAQGATPLMLALQLSFDQEYWWLIAHSNDDAPEYQKCLLHEWQIGDTNTSTNGRLTLPAPWQGSWNLRGAEATWIDLRIQTLDPGISLPRASLGLGSSEWRTNLPAPLSQWECSFSLDISPNNHCRCYGRLPSLTGNTRMERLQRYPEQTPPHPPHENTSRNETRPLLGDLAPFQQLGFLTLLLPEPPTKTTDSPSLELIQLSNTSSFYQQLLDNQPPELIALQKLAQAFIEGTGQWLHQYVTALATLPPPLDQLATPAATELLHAHLDDLNELTHALEALFGIPTTELVAMQAFDEQNQRLANSYLALLILDNTQNRNLDDFDRALRILALASHVVKSPQALTHRRHIESAQQARPLLDAHLFPLPQNEGGQAPPGLILGAGHLYELGERRRGYSLGPLAETTNLLPGEHQGQRVRHEASLHEHQQTRQDSDRQSRQCTADEQQRTDLPQLAQRTQFNDLAEKYGPDGLSQTISGNYLIEPVTPSGQDFQPVQSVRQEVQRVFNQALGQLRQRVRQAREQVMRSTWESSQWQRLTNPGETPKRGFHHWLLEQRQARLRDRGPRLLLYWALEKPAQILLEQLNAESGQRWKIPLAPWESQADDPGVTTPTQLNQADYLRLAARYGLQRLLQPPREILSLSQPLNADLSNAVTRFDIPEGYLATSLSYVSAGGNQGQLLLGGQVFDLATPHSATLPELSGSIAANLVGAANGQQVSLRVDCSARSYTSRLALWQTRAYAQLEQGYRQTQRDTCAALQVFCAGRNGGLAERLLDMLIGELLAATQSHYAQHDDLNQRRALQLEPWLRRTLSWKQAILACANPGRPGDWVPLDDQRDCAEGILQATQLRLSIPLDNAETERFCYLLHSAGRLWLGDEARTPVFATDSALHSLWEHLRGQPLAADQNWTFHVDSHHRYLCDELELLQPCSDE